MNFTRLMLGFTMLVMSAYVQAMETNFSNAKINTIENQDKATKENNKSNIEDEIDNIAEQMALELKIRHTLEGKLKERTLLAMGGIRTLKGYTMQLMKDLEQSEAKLKNLSRKYVTLKKSDHEIKNLLNEAVKLKDTFEITFWLPNGDPEEAIEHFLHKAKDKKSIMIAYYDFSELESEESEKTINGKSRKILQHTLSVREKRDIVNIINNSTEKHLMIEHIVIDDSKDNTYKNIIEKQKSISPEDFTGEIPSELKPTLKKMIFTIER